MANPTTYFGWVMPTATDLVTDLPADFNTFGQGVDTSMQDLLGGTTGQVLSKTSATDMDFTWINNDVGDITAVTAGTGISGGGTSGAVTVSIDTATTVDKTTAQTLTNKTLTSPALTTPTISTATTNGDLLYGTGSGALSRLGIGSTAQVLTVTAGIPSWAAAAAADASYSLLNAGGTALSGTTTTISGISGMSSLMIFIDGGSVSASATDIRVRFNGDTGSNYQTSGISWTTNTIAGAYNPSQTSAYFCVASLAANLFGGAIWLTGGKSSGSKVGYIKASAGSTTNNESYDVGFVYKGTATISSVSLVSSSSFDAGTIYVYGSAV